MNVSHGTILGGLSTMADLDAGLQGYRETLGLELVEQGQLPEELAHSWGCPGIAGSRYAVLRPASGAPCWWRLVEQPAHPDFQPTTTYGWAAFECTVEDVWQWPGRVEAGGFEIVGPPKKLENVSAAFIPMQVLGPGREMVYLNQVLNDMSDLDLPRAKSPVDRIFICVLATPDRKASLAWYTQRVGLQRGADYTLTYSMINQAFDLPADTQTTISMVRHGQLPIVELDDYPKQATARPAYDGMLPPGNALVTLAVRDLGECEVDWIAPPFVREGALYEGRRAGTAIGPAGELLELVEVG